MLSKLEAVWLACAVDCDGHVGMKLQQSKRKGKNYEYALPLLGFSNTSNPMARQFGKLIESKVHPLKEVYPYEKKKINRTSTSGTRKIKSLLEQIIPHMIAKRKRAEFVLAFCNHKLSAPGDHRKGRSDRLDKDLEWFREYQELFPSHKRNRREDPP
ncbi:hypothetical protein KKH23_06565 [Patescibacteria group bacterium]|nr:hypothetical protein [Patescibacteria group bacterium]